MALFLEVIVTSVADAVEAEAGGADRLELVAALEHGGLTPDFKTVENVLAAVTIPVRVMLRRNPSMSIKDSSELDRLKDDARRLKGWPIDGLVAGFLKDHAIDEDPIAQLAACASGIPITFHRAFDEAYPVTDALEVLKRLPQVDRILTHGSANSWPDRLASALQLQKMAGPKLKIIFAAGLQVARLAEETASIDDLEIHVGRAARAPQDVTGHVSRDKVAALKNLRR
jgi:copper homeostasis protein